MPFDVSFIDFDDVKNGALSSFDVVINAGSANSAWSGGRLWDDEVVTKLTEWAYKGGAFIGVNEPSALEGYDTFFRMAHVLGIDEDTGERICHGKYSFDVEKSPALCDGFSVCAREGLYLTDEKTRVFAAENGEPTVTTHPFGKGTGLYLSSFRHGEIANRTLLNLILSACGEELSQK